jgi:hypothetical protein
MSLAQLPTPNSIAKAEICGLNIIVHVEELAALVQLYERRGHFEEVIALLKGGLGLERAHMGIFTEMAILLSKYKPAKRMSNLGVFTALTDLRCSYEALGGVRLSYQHPQGKFCFTLL